MSEIRALRPVEPQLKSRVLAEIAKHGLNVLTYEIPTSGGKVRGISANGALLLHEMLSAAGYAFTPEYDPAKDVTYVTTWDNPTVPPGVVICYIRAKLVAPDGRVVTTYVAKGSAWVGVRNESRDDFTRRARGAYMAAFSKAQRDLYLHCVPPGAREGFIEEVRKLAERKGERLVKPEEEDEVEEPFQGQEMAGGGSRGGQGSGVDGVGAQRGAGARDGQKAGAGLGRQGTRRLLG